MRTPFVGLVFLLGCQEKEESQIIDTDTDEETVDEGPPVLEASSWKTSQWQGEDLPFEYYSYQDADIDDALLVTDLLLDFNDSLVGQLTVHISHVFGDESTELQKTHPISLTEDPTGFVLTISPANTDWADPVDAWITTGLNGQQPYDIQCALTSKTIIQCHNGITTLRKD